MQAARPLALFLSDLHLQPSHPATCAAFLRFLAGPAAAAEAVYLLGDIFEYWAGDDDLADPFAAGIVAALRRLADSGTRLYWIAGNRDFLVGPAFAAAAGLTLLSEPHVLELAGLRIALVHGDAECTDDSKYMAFRAQVRDPAWQAQFLALPLAQRKDIIAGLRQGSKAAQSGPDYRLTDVNPDAIAALFARTGCAVLIHGHTHQPALHTLGALRRYVLPDWECDAPPLRGGFLALTADGQLHTHPLP
ncbi:UDP-2,3-diacylglucosamine diphosphatase [Massilia sp. TS11]|uniref:UDP-2,3-diacylglucosamine diphosphatase n=1 Tax=Massilia sp. TS11 TaxID=2908003 RepID=UPI001EDBF5C8|nr:UDP-2,3-diacylglucosamine diphosphatase [Massilia sp. TS11]MCG2584180.1 UDP-2,3-diacylglucosamine diphosphatase [Massilia sp. TS11]